jgi:tetratricopeptide (TPR) repeat protein
LIGKGAPAGTIASGEDSTPSLVAFYDLAVSPTSFDFASFLARAELARRARRLGRIQVVMVPASGDGFWGNEPLSLESKRARVERLLIPLCELVPSCLQPVVCPDRDAATLLVARARGRAFPDGYTVERPVADAFQWAHVMAALVCGDELPGWRAPAAASEQVRAWLGARADGRRVVTLTLRETEYHTENNSDLAAWGAFARQLDRQRFLPVVVRDTARARCDLPPELAGLDDFPDAALDVRVRAALYDQADFHLTVSAGPMLLLWLHPECRSVVFKLPNFENYRSTPVPLRSLGLEIGNPTPLGIPHQRVVWELDTPQALERGFRELVAIAPEKRVAQEHPLVSARRLRDTGRLEAALRIYSHLQDRSPGDRYVRLARALAELRVPARSRPARAWRAARLILSGLLRPHGDPGSAELIERGLCEERLGLFSLAARRYRVILEREPEHPVALHRAGRLELRGGRSERARDLLRAAVRGDPYAADARFDLGCALRALGALTEARSEFRWAAACDPSHAAARHALEALRESGAEEGEAAAGAPPGVPAELP